MDILCVLSLWYVGIVEPDGEVEAELDAVEYVLFAATERAEPEVSATGVHEACRLTRSDAVTMKIAARHH